MKFRDKMFFAMTAVLTVIFAVFGTWMLSSYFDQLLKRETLQIDTQGQMYQYLYEMAYESLLDYGNEYAVDKAFRSVSDSVEKDGVRCFAVSAAGEVLFGGEMFETSEFSSAFQSLLAEMAENSTYACGIRDFGKGYCLLYICVSEISGNVQYLGISRDLTEIYEDRSRLQNQYYLALTILLFVGGICVYAAAGVISRPLQSLSRIAERISSGNFEIRSDYEASDELGVLARNFNHMADRLVTQMQEKEMEAKRQEDFTAAFAHELKTPLTSIIGYADMLNTMELTEEERREAYYYIYSQGKRLENLSHKLLELVSLKHSDLKKSPIRTRGLEEDIRNTMRPILMRRNIKGKVDLEGATLYGDRELLLSLFYNLVDNAAKAVDEGGFVLLKGRKIGEVYEIKVIDNGRGIPKEDISRIMEAFYMVDKSRSRREGGAGIGLSLCKQIVELHDGVMKIVSRPEEGTVIRLIFPLTDKGQKGTEDGRRKE